MGVSDQILHEKLFNWIEKAFPRKNGVIFGIASTLVISLTALFSKKLSHLSPFQILFYRFIGANIYQLYFIKTKGKILNFKEIFKPKYVLYGALSFICSSLFIFGLGLLDFSSAIILFHMSPIFSLLMKNERNMSYKDISHVFISFLGVALVVGPNLNLFKTNENGNFNFLPHLVCLTQAFLTSYRMRISKNFGQMKEGDVNYNKEQEEFSLLTANLLINLVLSLFSTFFISFNFPKPSMNEFALLVFTGVIALFSEWMTVKSLKNEKVTVILVLKSLRILISFLIEIWILGGKFELGRTVGAGLIFISTMNFVK